MKRIVGESRDGEKQILSRGGGGGCQLSPKGMGKRKNEKEFRHDLVCACFVPCFDFFSSVLDNRESETSSGEEGERERGETQTSRERERERL